MNTGLIGGTNNREKGVSVNLKGPKGEATMDADVVLLSIGRKPYTKGLALEKAGLETVDRGMVEINNTW